MPAWGINKVVLMWIGEDTVNDSLQMQTNQPTPRHILYWGLTLLPTIYLP